METERERRCLRSEAVAKTVVGWLATIVRLSTPRETIGTAWFGITKDRWVDAVRLENLSIRLTCTVYEVPRLSWAGSTFTVEEVLADSSPLSVASGEDHEKMPEPIAARVR